MARDVVDPVVNEHGNEEHPGWVMVGASRVSSTPGAVLFDSDIRHQHYVVVRVARADRKRDLNRDWLHAKIGPIVEFAMSEAQWASFVSSMNSGSGVPATLLYDQTRDGDPSVPGMPYQPRLQASMDEVHAAAEKYSAPVKEAFARVKEKPTKANIRDLEIALQNFTPNIDFVAKSLGEHAEDVVQRAKFDIEAFVMDKAGQLGIDPADIGAMPELTAGSEEQS